MAYTAQQLDYAKQIVDIGKQMGATVNDQKIALMVALDESELQMYANEKIPESLNISHEKVGSDGNSVGLFQQQVGIWGDASTLMNVDASARKFYQALFNVPGRDAMAPYVAAQTVQRSATPDGSNYAARQQEAEQLYAAIKSNSSTPLAGNNSGGSWFGQHGGWQRLGIFVLGAAILTIAASFMLSETDTFKTAMKAAVAL